MLNYLPGIVPNETSNLLKSLLERMQLRTPKWVVTLLELSHRELMYEDKLISLSLNPPSFKYFREDGIDVLHLGIRTQQVMDKAYLRNLTKSSSFSSVHLISIVRRLGNLNLFRLCRSCLSLGWSKYSFSWYWSSKTELSLSLLISLSIGYILII